MDNDSLIPKPITGRGGPRPGSGRPKGKLDKHTILARKAKEKFMIRVAKNADKLFNSQFDKAVGEKFLMRKVTEHDAKGKVLRTYHEIVDDPKTIIKYLDGQEYGGDPIDDEENYYYMTTKSADNAALSDMLNRGLGKPTEHVETDITSAGERLTGVSESQLTQLLEARAGRDNTEGHSD